MKKVFLMLMSVCSTMSVAWGASYNCKIQDIGMWSIKSSNEYLFVNTADYNHSNGKALVCGHMGADGCDNGTKVFVTGNHFHKGNARTDSTFYECSSSGANSWDAIGSTAFQKCSSTKGMRVITTVGLNDIYVPESVYVEYVTSGYYISDKFCFYPHGTSTGGSTDKEVIQKKCPSGRESGAIWEVGCDGIGIANGVKCGKRCNSDGTETNFVTECQKDYNLDELVGIGDVWKGKYKRCVKASGGGNDNRGGEQSSLQKCLQSRATEKGKACCYASRAVATYDAAKDECKCVAEGQEFDYAARECKTKVVPGKSFQCDEVYLNSLLKYKTTCKDSKEILDLVKKIEDLCKGQNPSASLFDEYVRQLGKLNPEDCGKVVDDDDDDDNEVVIDVVTESRGKILSASAELDRIASGFGTSVWKNKDGNFNTSRLVSDSVAGVVLGTAGGLITSNVVKKNQIKGGFEDIQCTVGGQVVAGWGDEFRVGIQ